MAGVIETVFRDAANEGHLAAFKPNPNRAAGAGGLAFASASAGFAVSSGFALAQPFATVLGTGTRFKVV